MFPCPWSAALLLSCISPWLRSLIAVGPSCRRYFCSYCLSCPQNQRQICQVPVRLRNTCFSGWPHAIQQLIDELGKEQPETRAAIDAYLEETEELYGIQLREDRIEKNPARRNVAKLCLNNFWGFLSKDPNVIKTKCVESVEEFHGILDHKEVKEFWFPNKTQAMMQFRDYYEPVDSKTSLICGIFTTAYARIEIYKYLSLAKERCYYCDTDCLFWKRTKDGTVIPCSTRLGEMKDELLDMYGPDARIASFAALGAKTYSYLIEDPHTGEIVDSVRKFKGITPTFEVDQKLTAQQMIYMVQAEAEAEQEEEESEAREEMLQAASTKVPQRNLKRDKRTASMSWQYMMKGIHPTLNKRMPCPSLDEQSLPFGWCKN